MHIVSYVKKLSYTIRTSMFAVLYGRKFFTLHILYCFGFILSSTPVTGSLTTGPLSINEMATAHRPTGCMRS